MGRSLSDKALGDNGKAEAAMRLDYNAITAWSAVAAALVAVVALIFEGRRSRFGLGVDLALRLNDYFLSTEFQKARQRAATAMKGEVFDGAYDVFNFFELVGMFTRRGVLDKTAVWSMYGYWIYHYWHAGKGHISSRKPATWRDFAYLYRIIMGVDKRERGIDGLPSEPTRENIARFLEREANLSGTDAPLPLRRGS